MKQAYLECGKIINTHGFRGTVKLESRCDSPEILADLKQIWFLEKGSYVPRRVKHASVFKQFVLMDIEGVESEDAANALREQLIYAARKDIPIEEGAHFIVDMIGLDVRHADTGEVLGKLIDVNQRGATDLYVVRTPHGEFLVPAVPSCIPAADTV